MDVNHNSIDVPFLGLTGAIPVKPMKGLRVRHKMPVSIRKRPGWFWFNHFKCPCRLVAGRLVCIQRAGVRFLLGAPVTADRQRL